MTDISELIGIIKGINFDGVINEMEVDCLQNWLNKNRNLTFSRKQAELIKALDQVLEDHVVTEDERELIVSLAENFQDQSGLHTSDLFELNGIIYGIVADDVINEHEIYRLKEWMDTHDQFVKENRIGQELVYAIEKILEDGIVTKEEKEYLLGVLKEKISSSRMKAKLDSIRIKVRSRKNIGLDLVDLLYYENAISMIHRQGEYQLQLALKYRSGMRVGDPEMVFISLSLIALMTYDGSFYPHVREVYKGLYEKYTEQSIEGLIRTILNQYRTNEERAQQSRIINAVLNNAIVPVLYLPSFFEFIFDIYKVNFEYELPENMNEEFRFAYEGLRDKLMTKGDNLQLSVANTRKSYMLIQSTKNLITDGSNLESVIGLSIIVVRLIDKYIWNQEVKLFNPYLKSGYEEWINRLDQKETRSRKGRSYGTRTGKSTGSYVRWEPTLALNDEHVYLVPPIHRVKAQYDYRQIRVEVCNGSLLLYTNNWLDIREIIGGYQINQKPIQIDEPLGKLRYLLLAGNEVIYDSRDKLYRDVIAFTPEGNTLTNYRDYSGTVIFCHKQPAAGLKTWITMPKYTLSVRDVKIGDVQIVDNTVFHFSSMVRPGILGEEYAGQYLKHEESGKLFPVYADASKLVFEKSGTEDNCEITINGRVYKLSEFSYTKTVQDDNAKFVVELPLSEAGIYQIEVLEVLPIKRRPITRFRFGLDPDYTQEIDPLSEGHYRVNVSSALLSRSGETEIEAETYQPDWLKTELRGEAYSYLLPLPLTIYQLDEKSWRPIEEDIWIREVKNDSVLRICAALADNIQVHDGKGEVVETALPMKVKGNCCEIAVGFLATYKNVSDFTTLILLKNGRAVSAIHCYNCCVLERDQTEIQFDPVKKRLSITPIFHGKGKVLFEIYNCRGDKKFTSKPMDSGETTRIRGISSFTEYTISFVEKAGGLSVQKVRPMCNLTRTFYAREDFVGRSFRIQQVSYDQSIRGRFVRMNCSFGSVYVRFVEQITNHTYTGELYMKTEKGIRQYSHINPVEIEICSDEIDGGMDLAITKEGDGLLLDSRNRRVLDTMDDSKAVDIFSYIIRLNGEGK